MPKRISDEEIDAFIDKFLKENAELFADLADSNLCPKCKKIVRGQKYNLGRGYHWAEGCKSCAETESGAI